MHEKKNTRGKPKTYATLYQLFNNFSSLLLYPPPPNSNKMQ